MKTRLPKAFLVVIMTTTTLAQEEIPPVEAYSQPEKIMTMNFSPYLASDSSQQIKVNKESVTLTGSDKLGLQDANGNFLTLGKISYTGYSLFGAGYFKLESGAGNVSRNYNVNGTLEIKENAQVQLGGQLKISTTGTENFDEYTGIIADKIVVRGNDGVNSLDSWNASVNTLEVYSGTVNLHTNGNGKYGNTHFVVDSPRDSKQVCIKSELNINGGSTTIGHATGTYLQTSFGKLTYEGATYVAGSLTSVSKAEITKSQINQSGGILKVQGDSVSVGGLNIDQKNGVMSISKGAYHDLADYGDCTINQSGDTATLDLGIIRAYNSQYSIIKNKMQENGVAVNLTPSIALSQTGAGTINLSGIDFTAEIGASTDVSSIKQSGAGSINLSGTYSGVTFDVKQSGSGTINMNSSMSLNEVKLSDENGTGGKLNIAAGAVVTVSSITIDGGSIVNNGTINGVVSMAMRAAGETINITDGELVNSGTINASINMSGGALVAEADSEIAGIIATGGDILVEGDFTMTGDIVLDGDAELIFGSADYTIDLGEYDVEFTGNSGIALTLGDADISEVVLFTGAKEDTYSGYEVTLLDAEGNSTGTAVMQYNANGDVTLGTAAVPEPTTTTLSLLALAALAARRRRK